MQKLYVTHYLVLRALAFATTNEKSQSTERCNRDVPKRQEQNNKREKPNTIFNEILQFVYVLGTRERDLIDSTIKYRFFLTYNS